MGHAIAKNNAGLTLIELMIAAGILTIGLVLLMSSVVNVNATVKSSDVTVRATHFNTSILESLRGRDHDAILQFNSDGSELAISNNVIQLNGIGPAKFYMWCVMDVSGTTTRYAIPMTDESLAALPATPNPMEIQVELHIDRGLGTGKELKYRSSSLVYH